MFVGKEYFLVAQVPLETARLVLWADDESKISSEISRYLYLDSPTKKIFQVISGDKTFTLGFQVNFKGHHAIYR